MEYVIALNVLAWMYGAHARHDGSPLLCRTDHIVHRKHVDTILVRQCRRPPGDPRFLVIQGQPTPLPTQL